MVMGLHAIQHLNNTGASNGSSSNAIDETILVPQRSIQSNVL